MNVKLLHQMLTMLFHPSLTLISRSEAISASRGVSAKRSLASREFALGVEALERFVACEPLRRVNKCVFGFLALESEPVDPRL
jgi:protein phosphatase